MHICRQDAGLEDRPVDEYQIYIYIYIFYCVSRLYEVLAVPYTPHLTPHVHRKLV